MPTTYAHYSFGQEVLRLLDDDLKNIIHKNMDLFNIGVHGPDILFYYQPLKSNDVSKLGHKLHSLTADSFFENARSVIKSCPDYEGACAYVAGFICHFMLDTQCHPYIRTKEGRDLTHGAIETEFDRLFMLKSNLDPLSYKPTAHIVLNERYAEIISWFLNDISKEDVFSSLKSMKFYLNLLVAPGFIKRFVLVNGLKISGNYEGMGGLIMSREPIEECKAINEKLYELYREGVGVAADIINEYISLLGSDEKLNKRFCRNFE